MITHSRFVEVRNQLMQRRKAVPRPRLPLSAERLYLGAMRNYAEAIVQAVKDEAGIPAERTDGFEVSRLVDMWTRQGWTEGGPWWCNPWHEDAMQRGPLQFGARTHRIIANVRLRVARNQANIPLDQVGHEVRRLGELDAKMLLGVKNTDLFLGRQVMQWRDENVALITNMTEDMLAQVGTVLEEFSGYRVEDLADQLEGTFNMTRARAELIARDQTLKLNSDIAEGAQRQVGITHYRWSTSNDESVRESHALLEGETFSWDEPPIVNQVEVDTKGKPERREHPGRDFQCRCVAIPVVEEYETPGEMSEGTDGRYRLDYSDDQPRDESGRWTSEAGGGSSMQHSAGVTIHNHDRVQRNAMGLLGRHITPQDVHEMTQVKHLDIPGAHSYEYTVRPHGSDGLHYEARVKDREGNALLEVKRQLETNYESGKRELEVHHDLMVVSKDLQGQGHGTALFDRQIQHYQTLGVTRVTTSAAWQGGQYTWPRLGFGLRDSRQLEGLKTEAARFLQERGVKADLSKVRSVHDLARMQVKGDKVGKAFLQWRGNQEDRPPLDLKFDLGPKSKELKDYVKTGKK